MIVKNTMPQLFGRLVEILERPEPMSMTVWLSPQWATHASRGGHMTVCGKVIKPTGWFKTDDQRADNVECKRCRDRLAAKSSEDTAR